MAPWLDDPELSQPEQRDFDAFISHAHANAELARRIEAGLESKGLSVWLDKSDIRWGGLLRTELQQSIRNSCVLILLWSKDAATSRWVSTEWLMAFHQGRFIIPCSVDDTPLLEWLGQPVWLDLRKERFQDENAVSSLLHRAVKEAPSTSNEVQSFPRRGADADPLLPGIEMRQETVVNLMGHDREKALEEQQKVDAMLLRARTISQEDPYLMVLEGYHLKNAYFLKHWNAITVGRPPRDTLLEEAEELFLKALSVNPRDMGAINGLGSVLLYRRELDAAEFFVRRSLLYAKKEKISYEAAQHDLKLLESIKRQMVHGGGI